MTPDQPSFKAPWELVLPGSPTELVDAVNSVCVRMIGMPLDSRHLRLLESEVQHIIDACYQAARVKNRCVVYALVYPKVCVVLAFLSHDGRVMTLPEWAEEQWNT